MRANSAKSSGCSPWRTAFRWLVRIVESRLRSQPVQQPIPGTVGSALGRVYTPGFLHVNIKYLPQMADETSRRYLFVAIDRATRWAYVRLYGDQGETRSTDFPRRLRAAAPMRIEKLLR